MDNAVKDLLLSKFETILVPTIDDTQDAANKAVLQWPKETALRMISEKKNKVRMNFISFWRTSIGFDWTRQRTPAARRGMLVGYNDNGTDMTQIVKAVPAKYDYEVCFWTRDLDHNQKLIEEYLWWQQDNPTMAFVFNDIYPLTPQLHFGSVVDESTAEVMLDKGLYFVFKVPLSIDGWIIKASTPITEKVILKVVLNIYDKDDLTAIDYTNIVNDESSEHDSDVENALRLSRKEITD